MIEFVIKGEIQTKQRPRATMRNGYATVYTPKDTINYENYVKSEYQRQCDEWLGDSPLNVSIDFHFKAPKDIEKLIELDYNILCVNHKDLDNLGKVILDALNGIAFVDDKQVIKLSLKKFYDKTEYVSVKINKAIGYTIEQAKKEYTKTKLLARYNELKNKKRNKAEQKRFEDLELWFKSKKQNYHSIAYRELVNV